TAGGLLADQLIGGGGVHLPPVLDAYRHRTPGRKPPVVAQEAVRVRHRYPPIARSAGVRGAMRTGAPPLPAPLPATACMTAVSTSWRAASGARIASIARW